MWRKNNSFILIQIKNPFMTRSLGSFKVLSHQGIEGFRCQIHCIMRVTWYAARLLILPLNIQAFNIKTTSIWKHLFLELWNTDIAADGNVQRQNVWIFHVPTTGNYWNRAWDVILIQEFKWMLSLCGASQNLFSPFNWFSHQNREKTSVYFLI